MSDFISNDISRNLFSEVISSFNTTLHDLQNKLNNEKLNCVEVKEELDVLKKSIMRLSLLLLKNIFL